MVEVSTLDSLRENPDVKKLLDFLTAPDMAAHRQEYISLLDYTDAITKQYNSILSELDTLKEKVSKITDKKNPLVIMTDNLETLAADIGMKLKNLKDDIISFTKNTLDTVKEKGLSALGSVFGFLHIKDGLQAMSSGLAKSVESLNNAVARVENLGKHNQDKATEREATQSPETQTASLSELLADTRFDFENMSKDELKATYEKLLAMGMNNELSADENVCLQYMVNEIDNILPHTDVCEPEHEAEMEQGAEM